MSQENLEIVRRFFEARNHRDFAALNDCLASDAEFDLSRSRSPYRGIYRGREDISGALQSVLDAWGEFAMDLEDPVEIGDEVVVSVSVAVRGRTSGVEWRGQGANVFTLKHGKIVRFTLFQTRSEALEAAGLSE